jgi:DNA-binding MarR family transcriptional regulator
MQDVLTQSPRTPRRDAGGSQSGAGLLFLREEEIRIAQDVIFFAMRDLTEAADTILMELHFGRAHHRTLHWVGRKPGLKVGELLTILAITKQSLTRVLGPLIRQGYIEQVPGQKDRRQRLLTLTAQGVALERRLFEAQRERLITAYREAGGAAVDGFRKVLRGLTQQQGRDYIDAMEAGRAARGHRG